MDCLNAVRPQRGFQAEAVAITYCSFNVQQYDVPAI